VRYDVLRERVLILKSYYVCKPEIQTHLRVLSYTIDALDNIANVVKKILQTEPSIKNTTKCTDCKDNKFSIVVLEPNHKIIGKKGFGSLEKSLGFLSSIHNIRCNDPCLGQYTWFREKSIHIFIELDKVNVPICDHDPICEHSWTFIIIIRSFKEFILEKNIYCV